jgi:hypothetical protein
VEADRIRDESGCVLRYERTFMRPLLPTPHRAEGLTAVVSGPQVPQAGTASRNPCTRMAPWRVGRKSSGG